MKVLTTRAELAELDALRGARPLVLVPTMGALHEGHLSLVRTASALGPVVVSIFVNPTQFGPNEDFAAYPRDLQHDLDLLAPLAPAAVFAPEVATVYPAPGGVSVQPGRFAAGLCGGTRPGHFAGVLTVVAKLFGLVRPDVAVFGRKDAQQCLVIDEMVRDLVLPVRLIDAPTVREADGLAMSSRNRYLDAAARRRALALSRALAAGRTAIEAGERRAAAVAAAMMDVLAGTDAPDYAAVRRLADWSEPDRLEGRTLLAVAARVEPARLIDNVVLDIRADGVRECALLDADDNA
ncbi:MAG TPA: pantoate--beta-alanine ligase [Candidatus Krumholzibacteria bacterium]|nr:pantoate--beta-alanine ligase [Candidatus Krumholzibacteria bacterium]